jgi:Domain of unknown function (DUF1707)
MRYRWDPLYPTTGHRTGLRSDAHLRASDAERNDVAERLSRHFADGRLDQVEFKERLDRAMGAVTRSDLDGLFDDLPPLDDEPSPARPHRRRLPLLLLLVLLVAAGAGTTISAVHLPWMLIALVGLFLWLRPGRRHGARSAQHQIDR